MDKEGVKENGPPQVGEGHDMYIYCFISMESIKCDQYLFAMEERERERERLILSRNVNVETFLCVNYLRERERERMYTYSTLGMLYIVIRAGATCIYML